MPCWERPWRNNNTFFPSVIFDSYFYRWRVLACARRRSLPSELIAVYFDL